MGSAATLSEGSSRYFGCTLALLESKHIYADYERSLVEQELRGYGLDLDDHPPVPPEAVAKEEGR
jgi:hypothetical protein